MMNGKRVFLSLALAATGNLFSAEGESLPDSSKPATETVPSVSAPAVETHAQPTQAKPREEPGVPVPSPTATSAQDRLTYVGVETLYSTYAYGLAFPLAWEVDNWRILIGAPLIAAPIAFGTHLWISRRLEFKESHRKGTTNMSLLSLYGATALPMAFSDDWHKGYRTGVLFGALLYPFGTWYGYHLGDVFRDEPQRLDTKFGFALMYGLLGFGIPALFSSELDSLEAFRKIPAHTLRWGLGESVGFMVVGHFLADFAPGPKAPDGVRIGIGTHAVLGGLTGLEIAMLRDVSTVRPWIGSALLGVLGGVTEGVFFFHDKTDNRERGLFSLLGATGGGLMGAGVQLLFNSGSSTHGKMVAWSTSVMLGAWLGYGLTYLLTTGMEDKPHSGAGHGWDAPVKWAVNPVPIMEYVSSRGDPSMRWKVPGFSYRF